MRRRLLLLLAALMAAFALVLVTVPYWLGPVARAGGAARGFTFQRYERIGYARFALHDVEVKRANVRVTATRVEASTPLLWGWRHWRHEPDQISVGEWAVQVERRPAAQPAAPKTESGWVPLQAKLHRIAGYLDRFLRSADAGPGAVRWTGGELTLGGAKWQQRELAVTGLTFRKLTADAVARFAPGADRLDVQLRTEGEPAVLTLASAGPSVTGELVWLDQKAPVTAQFAPRGWLPAQATVVAEDWRVPAEKLRLNATYAQVRGRAKVDWDGGALVADVHANSEPLEGKKAPPLEVNVQGRGTPQAFSIQALQVNVPGVHARLSDPVTIDRTGKLREGEAARFSVDADLAQQPWFKATGRATGEVRLASDLAQSPVLEFRMQASELTAEGVGLSAVAAEGRLQWPKLEITQATVAAGEGERLVLRGGWDFRQKEVLAASVEGTIRRSSVARWLPAQPQFDALAIRGRFAGSLAQGEHSGEVRADDVRITGLNPVGVALEWRGRGVGAESFHATATAGATRLEIGGAADRESLKIGQLNFSRDGVALLSLGEPALFRWKPALTLSALHLAGPKGRIDGALTWGATGRIEASARNIPSAWLADLVALKGPAWQVDLLAFTGQWDRGPMEYAFTVGAAVDLGEGRNAAVNASARGDKEGFRIDALRATEGDATVLNAVGRLPLTLNPGAKPLVRLDEKGALVLDASAAPHSAFWPKLAAATGIELKDPTAVLHLKGTWARPQGTVQLNAAGVTVDAKRVKREIPAVEALAIELHADPGGVNLTNFSVRVEGQPVRARGRLPVAEGRWTDVVKQPRLVLERSATLHLEVPEAEVAVFNRFLPAVLAPQGRLAVDVKYEGGALNGVARLRNAASRPLGPLGVLQEINADVEMAGRKVSVRSLAAKAGGQPVTLTGSVELPAGGLPRYDLTLRGDNLPFVRQTGLLLRGNLDLKLQTPREGPPRITGQVKLRDSLFLQDVRAFLPRAGAGPTRRPPYFSVDTPPLNTWGLAIEVTGNEFMRLRTPVFNGVASAHVRLGGTLGEPRALGEITINEGYVRMPFASFEVKQGSVRLTEADPDRPEVYLRGTARRYGYDLTMEIEGAANAPNVEFTSSPALDSEQVLLMVMTGAAPSNEINYSGTRRVAQIGAFLGQSLLGSLGADSDNAERLSISSGEKISRQGKETYDVEYKLSDRWTATGEYNEFDEYNAGLKWRVLPRAKKGEAKEEPSRHVAN